jgi:GlpG protein
MRSIGILKNLSLAERFSDFLYTKGIHNDIEPADEGTWEIWVHSEDQLEEAAGLLQVFLADPDDTVYTQAQRESQQKASADRKKQARSRTRYVDVRTTWGRDRRAGIGFFTLIFIIISVVVGVLTKLGMSHEVVRYLTIADFWIEGRDMYGTPGFQNILEGQIWRVLTPIFLHFGLIHLLFNMLWLKDLGSMIENRQGTIKLVMLVVIIGVVSNIGQYLVTPSPIFGGMSGVVYGLLGYIWFRGKFDPSSGLYLHNFIVWMMGIWFFLCLFGFVGNIANTAHAVGLVMGLAWGYLSAKRIAFLK